MRFVGFICLVVLSACASVPTAQKLNGIQLGMSKAEVIERLGQPVSISAQNKTEFLNYKLTETETDAKYEWVKPYYVRLIDGKVESYGRVGDFNSTQTPTVKIQQENVKSGQGE